MCVTGRCGWLLGTRERPATHLRFACFCLLPWDFPSGLASALCCAAMRCPVLTCPWPGLRPAESRLSPPAPSHRGGCTLPTPAARHTALVQTPPLALQQPTFPPQSPEPRAHSRLLRPCLQNASHSPHSRPPARHPKPAGLAPPPNNNPCPVPFLSLSLLPPTHCWPVVDDLPPQPGQPPLSTSTPVSRLLRQEPLTHTHTRSHSHSHPRPHLEEDAPDRIVAHRLSPGAIIGIILGACWPPLPARFARHSRRSQSPC